MKMNKGISLIILILTIVVMLILFGVIVANFDNVGEEATAMEFLNNISIIETKVMIEQYNAGTEESYSFKGTKLTSSNRITIGNTVYPIGTDKWYLLNTNDLVAIGVKNVQGSYVVNYTTGKVISVEGIYVFGKNYYTFEEVAEKIDFQY